MHSLKDDGLEAPAPVTGPGLSAGECAPPVDLLACITHQLVLLTRQALADAKLQPKDLASVEVTGGSSRVPSLVAILRDTLGADPSRTLNAKECIARGCALNCAMLSPIFRCAAPPEVVAWRACLAWLSGRWQSAEGTGRTKRLCGVCGHGWVPLHD